MPLLPQESLGTIVGKYTITNPIVRRKIKNRKENKTTNMYHNCPENSWKGVLGNSTITTPIVLKRNKTIEKKTEEKYMEYFCPEVPWKRIGKVS